MGINIEQLASAAFNAAVGAAKGQAILLEDYLKARAQLIAQGTKDIFDDRAANKINDDDVKFAFDQIRKAEASGLRVIDAAAKAAAQDAINAALNVAAGAINTAIGFAILPV